eukprot:7902980-Pyramimonas_sp.AAC.1
MVPRVPRDGDQARQDRGRDPLSRGTLDGPPGLREHLLRRDQAQDLETCEGHAALRHQELQGATARGLEAAAGDPDQSVDEVYASTLENLELKKPVPLWDFCPSRRMR